MRRIEPERVEVVRRSIYSDDLPPELDGLVICHISDLHITADPRNSAAVADAIRSVNADLYAITGDLVHGPRGVPALATWLDALAGVIEPALAVFGNAEHKRRVNTGALRQELQARGIRVLSNECAVYGLRDADLQIVGLDDPHSGHSRAAAAFGSADPARWTLVLVHSPEGVLELDGRRADLVLAGHTHGGQILLPGLGWISDNTHNRVGLISGYYGAEDLAVAAGLSRGPRALYVSRGLGTSGWPLRFRCRPELPLLTLRRTSVEAATRSAA
jgi:predicted MPP superfamily phosphohydrolase